MASDSTVVACKKSFGAQFIESRKHKQILMNLLLKHFQSLLSKVNQETMNNCLRVRKYQIQNLMRIMSFM